MLPQAALIFINYADLHAFNLGLETIEEVVMKIQRLLDAWYDILKFTGRDLNLSKCY